MSKNKEPLNYIVKNKGPNRAERMAEKANQKRVEKMYDKKFKGDTEWGSLNELYLKNKDMFKPISLMVNAIKKIGVQNYLTTDELDVFQSNLKLLNKDVKAYQLELDKIHAIHSDKTGHCKLEDFELMMEIGEYYHKWTENYYSVITPVYDHVADLLHIAESRKLVHDNPDMAIDILEKKIANAEEEAIVEDSENEVEDGQYTEVDDSNEKVEDLVKQTQEKEGSDE